MRITPSTSMNILMILLGWTFFSWASSCGVKSGTSSSAWTFRVTCIMQRKPASPARTSPRLVPLCPCGLFLFQCVADTVGTAGIAGTKRGLFCGRGWENSHFDCQPANALINFLDRGSFHCLAGLFAPLDTFPIKHQRTVHA